ncbi:uncharacterized protein [Pyrus communis]|uniref:uncharacterized protein n=1 Tax=Pyrus communis TaxID=23211 RepID=UPI0035C173C0
MEAVDVSFPVDVAAVPKFLGVEALVRAGVTVKELEPCDSDRVSVRVSAYAEACSSSLRDKEVTNAVSTSEYESTKLSDLMSQCKNQGEESSRHLHGRGKSGFLLDTGAESVQLEKPGKVSKLVSLSSKRPRVDRLEDPTSVAADVDGIKDMSFKLGPVLTKCGSSDKTQLVKPKNNFTSKRGEKRNLKLPAKTKQDSFSIKPGLASFSSAAGGNNFYGVHGLKSDNHDVTKLVDDVPLNELLDGTYKCPSLSRGKGKKPANVNDSFLHAVKKACSTLQQPRSVQPQLIAEVESNSDKVMSPWPLSTTSVAASGVGGDKGEPFITDLSTCNEDSHRKPVAPVNPLDLPLCEPKYVLERLALPPHKDLESVLLDAAKPASFSKNTPDPCSGKQISRRASLPSFPWSHTSNGHCRSSSDAAKQSISRGTCQGRWLRVDKNILSSLGNAADNLTDLESLTYDQSLVPSARLKVSGSQNKVSPSISVSLSRCQRDSLSNTTPSNDSYIPKESGGKLNHSGDCNDENCPKVLSAAQTLCDMATRTSSKNPDGIIRWPKKPSQKAMKARKLKSIEKPEEAYGTSVAVSGSDNPRRSVDQMLPPKKPKLSLIDDKRDFTNFSSVRQGTITWSTPRSSRSSPGRSVKESVADIKHSTADVVKHSYMMPPPARVPEKTSNKREKQRKLLTTEWNKGRDRLD